MTDSEIDLQGLGGNTYADQSLRSAINKKCSIPSSTAQIHAGKTMLEASFLYVLPIGRREKLIGDSFGKENPCRN